MRFSAAKNSKNTIPGRNWRDPDAPTAIMTITHAIAIAISITITNTIIIVISLTLTLTYPQDAAGTRCSEYYYDCY